MTAPPATTPSTSAEIALLLQHLAPGVWKTHAVTANFGALAAALGWRVIELDLGRTPNKQELLDDLATQASFPAHFGRNWDAAADCLGDLDLGPGRQALIIVRRAAAGNQTDGAVLLDIVSEAAEEIGRIGGVLNVVWESAEAPSPFGDQPFFELL